MNLNQRAHWPVRFRLSHLFPEPMEVAAQLANPCPIAGSNGQPRRSHLHPEPKERAARLGDPCRTMNSTAQFPLGCRCPQQTGAAERLVIASTKNLRGRCRRSCQCLELREAAGRLATPRRIACLFDYFQTSRPQPEPKEEAARLAHCSHWARSWFVLWRPPPVGAPGQQRTPQAAQAGEPSPGQAAAAGPPRWTGRAPRLAASLPSQRRAPWASRNGIPENPAASPWPA